MSYNSNSSCILAATIFALIVAVTSNVAQRHETSLLQQDVKVHSGKIWLNGETCTPLKNELVSFTVKLCIGTPRQCFQVVADTGSNSVIVPSCVCKESKGAGCKDTKYCFRGKDKSSTFHVHRPVEVIKMAFGDGSIVAAVATDVVSIGGLSVTMEDGVLLILDRSKLEISGDFHGILGLGAASNAVTAWKVEMPAAARQHELTVQQNPHELNSVRMMDCSLEPSLCDEEVPLNRFRGKGWLNKMRVPILARIQHGAHTVGNVSGVFYKEKLFTEKGKVARFSMCFNDGKDSGALRLGVPPFTSPLRNVGKHHWGLDFQGLSVGAHGNPAPAKTIFCGPETMKPGMDSPCGIIPDSGTTLIRGPEEQVVALEKSICSKWERCQKHSKGAPSSAAFRQLIKGCGDWLKTTEHGLLEIPSLFFHVKSAAGSIQAYELTAWAWVTRYPWFSDGHITTVCESLLGSRYLDYETKKHGPIWIVGMPLFYEYNVGFDMSTNQMSLKRGKCESCSDHGSPVSLSDNGLRRWPRTMHGKPRIPDYNVDLPL